MVYLIVVALTIISIVVIVLLFDFSLFVELKNQTIQATKFTYDYIKNIRHNLLLKFSQLALIKRDHNDYKSKKSLGTLWRRLPSIYILSLIIIILTCSLCYWIINYTALDVYHNTDTYDTPYNAQINQLLLGERLQPPPSPPEELFAQLDAEIAIHRATKVDDGYWPEQSTGTNGFPDFTGSANNSTSNNAPIITPQLGDVDSIDMLTTHLNNGYINIRNADRNWNKMNSEFVQRLLTVYKIMHDQYGYEMVLLEGYRSPERQARLLAKGSHVTKAGSYRSYHQFGLAGDSAFIRNGKIVISERDPWAMRGYKLYGKVAKSVGLVWGGDWRMKDLGHVELRKKGVLGHPEKAQILINQ